MRQTSSWPLVSEWDPSSPISEAYRSLRTNVRFALGRNHGQVVCITSSLPGEGKSLTAANLAVAHAKEGRRTLLIDADLRKPVLHRVFQVSVRHGLGFALGQPEAWRQAVSETGIPALSLLPGGTLHGEPADLLASDGLERLIAETRGVYDTVLIDTPALLPFADARIVAARSDGVLLVIGAGKVKRRQAEQALKALRQVRAHVLGTVVNG